MTNIEHLDRLRGHFHTGEIPIARPDCLDVEMISALADGTLAADARAQALAHMATCVYCRRAIASVAGALADGPVTHEIEVVEDRVSRSRRVVRIVIPLAAAATVLVLLWAPTENTDPIHRGGSQETVPVPVGPVGAVADGSSFLWKAVAGADRYRVTLFDTRGDVLYETETLDTTMVLPDSARLIIGQLYLWKVEARTSWDRWTESELVQFTIARPPPR